MARFWELPEGVHIGRDGTWTVGGLPVQHAASLRYLKKHLRFEPAGAFLVQGERRLPVTVEGPPFVVTRLVIDAKRGEVVARLDDGSEERLGGREIVLDADTGRFECPARGGASRAVLSRAAHQTLLELVEEEAGAFFLPAGPRRIPVRA